MTRALDRRRRHRRPRRPLEHRPDPYYLGIREARAGVAKTGSYRWVESGRAASEWFPYSRGFDGEPQGA